VSTASASSVTRIALRPAQAGTHCRFRGTSSKEEAVDVDESVVGADPVDAAMALHESHRVPREIDADDVSRLLQVDTLR
jgi:site-specific recombinase XerC